MKYALLPAAALLLALCCAQAPVAQDEEDPKKDWTWQDWAKSAELSEADIKRLERDKVLLTNQTYRQSFDAYIGSKLPVFVTSDAVLNAFHVLFEESILRLETANAPQVRAVLVKIWEGLKEAGKDIKGKPELLKAAQFRARTVIAVALKLYGEKVEFPKDIDETAEAEVKLILAGSSVAKPKWLGEPDAGFMAINYARFTPRGFYTRNEALQRHFRALSWLQAIPFRVKLDEELLAAYLIGGTITYQQWDDFAAEQRFDTTWRCFSRFLGTADDWDLRELKHECQFMPHDLAANDLEDKRKSLLEEFEKKGGPQINDQLRFVPDDPRAAAEPNFRLVSAYRLPDGVLFSRTTDPRQFKRALPTGLEVAALLGSKFGEEQIRPEDKPKIMETVRGAQALVGKSSVYALYLDCLSALVDAPEQDAPAFLGGEPWQAKQCNALLAGWAQMRHTWALQAKLTEHYLGMAHTYPGFVEPEPEFFSRLGSLLEVIEGLLTNAGALTPNAHEAAAWLREYAELVKRLKFEEGLDKTYEKMTAEEYAVFERGLMALFRLHKMERGGKNDRERGKRIAESAAKAEEIAGQIEAGTFKDRAALDEVLLSNGADLRPHWRSIRQLVRRLESMAHKQLRRLEFSESEKRFLHDLGEQLAGIMLYGGNSWLTPRDDAPRAVSVFSNPNLGVLLHVGIDRPRALYVLYPWKDKEVLCRGAVLPYHEFTSEKPLTDAAFKGLLDSDKRPNMPAWLDKFASGLGAAKFAKDD